MNLLHLKRDLDELKIKVDRISPSEKEKMEVIRSYVINHNQEVREALIAVGDYIIFSHQDNGVDLRDVIDGKAKLDPNIQEHKKYAELLKHFQSLFIKGYKNLTDEDYAAIDKLLSKKFPIWNSD